MFPHYTLIQLEVVRHEITEGGAVDTKTCAVSAQSYQFILKRQSDQIKEKNT